MAIRVLHVATGNVGRIALSQLIEDPRFELAAWWCRARRRSGGTPASSPASAS